MIDWVQGKDDWSNSSTTDSHLHYTVQADYGWFHVYAFTMTLGMILAIGFSAWKFYKKDLSLTQLAFGVIIIVPLSLFGASFFGKLNANRLGVNAGEVGFWGLFAFWDAGMAIHGGVYVGSIAGMIVFYIMGRKTKVSLWTYMDAIIPNILLGQAVGRFGNFFNHEVMGAPVGKPGSLSWLPDWITTNTQMVYKGNSGVVINGISLQYDEVYQMAPIFFIESISLLIAWFLITFILPNIGKWIGSKPWKLHPDEFTLSWEATFKNIFMPWTFRSNRNLYNQTIEEYASSKDGKLIRTIDSENNESYFVIWKQAFNYNPNYQGQEKFKEYVKIIEQSNYSKTKKRYLIGKALNKANNPDGYAVTKVGAEASAYFFVWNIVRFALELQRPDDHLFIMYEKGLSLGIIMATAIIGLIGMILTQNIIPIFFRQPGFIYEKDYFVSEPINKEWFGKRVYEFDEVEEAKKAERNKDKQVNKINKQKIKEEKAKAKLEKLKNK